MMEDALTSFLLKDIMLKNKLYLKQRVTVMFLPKAMLNLLLHAVDTLCIQSPTFTNNCKLHKINTCKKINKIRTYGWILTRDCEIRNQTL